MNHRLVVCVFPLVVFLIGTAPCQAQTAADVTLVNEYIVLSAFLDTIFSTPLAQITVSDSGNTEKSIAYLIARYESKFRRLNRMAASCKVATREILSRMKSPEIRSTLGEVMTTCTRLEATCSDAFKLFEEINGDAYKVVARSDEITDLSKTIELEGLSRQLESLHTAVSQAAHRSLGW